MYVGTSGSEREIHLRKQYHACLYGSCLSLTMRLSTMNKGFREFENIRMDQKPLKYEFYELIRLPRGTRSVV